MTERIAHYINENHLLDATDLHLVALSGGADSVALLRILLQLGYRVEAIHCNFKLRDGESDRDEAFCKSLCKALDVPIHLIHFDTRAYAQAHHISIEMAARELRYNYFEQLRRDIGAATICVAHHKNDQAETVLLNIVRGTGIQGLTGMKKKNGFIVRPLLSVSRDEIVAFLDEIGQNYITDSSNLVADVKRNKIRLNVLPLLKDINPSFVDSIATMVDNLSEASKLIEDSLEVWTKRCVESAEEEGMRLNISVLKDCPSTESLLHHILSAKGFTPATIRQIASNLDAQTGTTWLSKAHELIVDRGCMHLLPIKERPASYKFPEEGYYLIADEAHIKIELKDITPDFTVEKDASVAMLDAESIAWPLILRPIEQGDRFCPLGMKGSKLISDFLTDRKVSMLVRRKQMLLVDASQQPLWLMNQRIDNRHKINSDTIKAIIVRYII